VVVADFGGRYRGAHGSAGTRDGVAAEGRSSWRGMSRRRPRAGRRGGA
jgi:hypothetical protein